MLKRYTVSGRVPFDIQVLASDETEARMAWHASLATFADPPLPHGLPAIELAFFTDEGKTNDLGVDDVSEDSSLGDIPAEIVRPATEGMEVYGRPHSPEAAERILAWAGQFLDDWLEDHDPGEGAEPQAAAAMLAKAAPFILAAVQAFQPDAINQLRAQLKIVRHAVERAGGTFDACGETHPAADIAEDCEAGSRDMTEALWFLDQIALALPTVVPTSMLAEAEAMVAAREARKPPKLAVVIRGGVVDRIVSTKPVEALVVDTLRPGDSADPDQLIWYHPRSAEIASERKLATVGEIEVETNPPAVHRIAEAQRAIIDQTDEPVAPGQRPGETYTEANDRRGREIMKGE